MIIDASVFVAILLDEPESYEFFEKIMRSSEKNTIPSAVWETCVSITNRLQISATESSQNLMRLLTALEISIVAIPPEVGFAAVHAYYRFGKGRHPAALNFGDCLVYAVSKVLNQSLLFKGDDFSKTDVIVA